MQKFSEGEKVWLLLFEKMWENRRKPKCYKDKFLFLNLMTQVVDSL